MIIDKLNIGARAKTTKYAICADATETGDEPKEIARFDTLELATVVMRYMRGDSLSDDDEQRAKEAIKAIDKPKEKQ